MTTTANGATTNLARFQVLLREPVPVRLHCGVRARTVAILAHVYGFGLRPEFAPPIRVIFVILCIWKVG